MADGLNRVMLLGNLGAEPELKLTQSGSAILRLRIATTESYLDKATNERKERTEWHSVTLFGKRAEGLSRILNKGSRIYVEGQLRTSSYEKDGEKRYRTEVIAGEVILCGGGPAKAGERSTSGPRPLPKPGDGPKAPLEYDEVFGPGNDDDLPF